MHSHFILISSIPQFYVYFVQFHFHFLYLVDGHIKIFLHEIYMYFHFCWQHSTLMDYEFYRGFGEHGGIILAGNQKLLLLWKDSWNFFTLSFCILFLHHLTHVWSSEKPQTFYEILVASIWATKIVNEITSITCYTKDLNRDHSSHSIIL